MAIRPPTRGAGEPKGAMGDMGKWVAGALGGVVALIGLFFAANASDDGVYYAGLVIFLVGVIFVFYQLKRGLDAAEAEGWGAGAVKAAAGGGASKTAAGKAGPSKSASTKSSASKSTTAKSSKSASTKSASGKTSSGKSASRKSGGGSKSSGS